MGGCQADFDPYFNRNCLIGPIKYQLQLGNCYCHTAISNENMLSRVDTYFNPLHVFQCEARYLSDILKITQDTDKVIATIDYVQKWQNKMFLSCFVSFLTLHKTLNLPFLLFAKYKLDVSGSVSSGPQKFLPKTLNMDHDDFSSSKVKDQPLY